MSKNGIRLFKQVLMENGQKPKNFRDALRARVGSNGELIWDTLVDLAEGRAWQVELPDGRVSQPMIPSSDVRLRAAQDLRETLFGRAVLQTEAIKAEEEAQNLAQIRALSDDELRLKAQAILAKRAIDPGQETDAELVSESQKLFEELSIEELARSIHAATIGDEDE